MRAAAGTARLLLSTFALAIGAPIYMLAHSPSVLAYPPSASAASPRQAASRVTSKRADSRQSVAAQALAKLDEAKLEAEISKLKAEAKNASGLRGFLANYGVLTTALVAFAGVGITLRGQNKEQARQRNVDLTQRRQDLEQREIESAREVTGRFSQLLLDLGSASEPVQAGATVSLLSFLERSDGTLHHQVRLAVLANLKVTHPPAITKLLIRTFEQAMTSLAHVPFDPVELDFSDAQLFGVRLPGLDLEGVNLSGANLDSANLEGTSLRNAIGKKAILNGALLAGASLFNARLPGAQCIAARFLGADLVNAHLEGANLRDARFDGARLQAAHIERSADLRGARFEGANVADTYFRDALFDDAALRSLRKAENWDKAHVSEATALRLGELAD